MSNFLQRPGTYFLMSIFKFRKMLACEFGVVGKHGLSPLALGPQYANPSTNSHANVRCHAFSIAVCCGFPVSYSLHRTPMLTGCSLRGLGCNASPERSGLIMAAFCHRCGQPLLPEAEFCQGCGGLVLRAEPTPILPVAGGSQRAIKGGVFREVQYWARFLVGIAAVMLLLHWIFKPDAPEKAYIPLDYAKPIYTTNHAIICPVSLLSDRRADHDRSAVMDMYMSTLTAEGKAKDLGCEVWTGGIEVSAKPMDGTTSLVTVNTFAFTVPAHLTNDPNGSIQSTEITSTAPAPTTPITKTENSPIRGSSPPNEGPSIEDSLLSDLPTEQAKIGGAVFKKLEDCLALRIPKGSYSSTRSANPAAQVLTQGCTNEYVGWIYFCERTGIERSDCEQAAVGSAQAAIKRANE